MHYVDIGAVADTFGGKIAEPTCLAVNSDDPTRRDYPFVSDDLFPAVLKFKVVHDDEVPVHATLCVQLDFKAMPHMRREAHKPGSLYDALGEGCRTFLEQSHGECVLHDPLAHPEHLN